MTRPTDSRRLILWVLALVVFLILEVAVVALAVLGEKYEGDRGSRAFVPHAGSDR